MTIEEFFTQFVDGYLLNDLKSMADVTVPAGQTSGGVGYPIVTTTLAGMELLGELLMPNTDAFDGNKGNDYFLNYWDNYFAVQNSAYTGLGRLFRQLMRNGIAHTFVAKPGVMVEKGTNRQMSIDRTRQEIYIDCNVFYKEFEDSYLKLVRPILDGSASARATTKDNMQTRFDNLSAVYSNDTARLFAALPTLHEATIDTPNRMQVPVSPFFTTVGTSGASGMRQEQLTTTTTTSSTMEQGTATIPLTTTVPLPTPSGMLPPEPEES
jgi:hypothetical protein